MLPTAEPGFIQVDHKSQVSGDSPQNVTKIIEKAITVDLSSIEDNLTAIALSLHNFSKNQIIVHNQTSPVTVNVPEVEPPIVSVMPPSVNIEPAKVNVYVNSWAILWASLLPTGVLLFDIYLRVHGK